MLCLVLSDWHVSCIVEENVCRHQDGVRVEAEAAVLVTLSFFLFKLYHLVEPTQRSKGGQEPLHLEVSRHVRLHKQRASEWVNATSY